MADVKLKPLSAGWLLVIVHCVGLIGFFIPQTRALMNRLVWVNILFTFIVLFCYHKKWTKEFVFSGLLVALIGYLLEVIGVKTGYIFGYYQYGPALGYAFWDTPLMMMVNWLTIIYITRQIAEMIAKDAFLVSIIAAVLMVAMDFFIEPFAIRHGLWQWNSGHVPMHNYVGWLVAGIIIQYLFIRAIKYPPNKLSLPVYLIQLGFFLILYFLNL